MNRIDTHKDAFQARLERAIDSSPITGGAGMTLNFRSIRLRDGSAYQFNGVIDQIRPPD